MLVTDDFNMGAAYASDGGIGEAAVLALNAGVDLILISYDGDQFYPVMHALLQADAVRPPATGTNWTGATATDESAIAWRRAGHQPP